MESAENIKSLLKHLLNNYQINEPLVVKRLEKVYNYSCVVWVIKRGRYRNFDYLQTSCPLIE